MAFKKEDLSCLMPIAWIKTDNGFKLAMTENSDKRWDYNCFHLVLGQAIRHAKEKISWTSEIFDNFLELSNLV